MSKQPATIIGVSTAKGGSSKTFTSIVLAHLLSTSNKEKGLPRKAHKTLVIDLDFQSDLSENLSKKSNENFIGKSVFEALQGKDIRNCIHKIHENLDLLPATSHLALLDKYIFENNIKNSNLLLKNALNPIKKDYDFIIVDTSPSLSKSVIIALSAIEKLIIPMQTQDFGYRAVGKFSNTVLEVNQTTNPELELLGILPVLMESRGRLDKDVLSEAKTEYGDFLFKTIIRRKSTLGRLINEKGFSEKYSTERKALEDYYSLYEELMKRVKRA